MNTPALLGEQHRYFADSYQQFAAFGGPCVYFHRECLRAGREAFLSERHLEMLYASLTAWGLHRMGDAEITKTKLQEWTRFRGSILTQANGLREFRSHGMLELSEGDYSAAVLRLHAFYTSFDLSMSGATVVVNSKALYHLFPEFIPPIDRQYTIRFFTQPPEKWRDQKGRFRKVQLPSGIESQFKLFHETCVKMKRFADSVEPALFEKERREHGVTAPKALDNAIVSFVRTVSVRRAITATHEIGL